MSVSLERNSCPEMIPLKAVPGDIARADRKG